MKALSRINNEPEYFEDSEEKVLNDNIAILEEAKLNILLYKPKQSRKNNRQNTC